MINLENLKEPTFIESNWDTQYKELVSLYEDTAGVALSKGQIESILLGIFAYRENLLRIMINDIAKQNLLAYAKGEILDHLGSLLGVQRLESSPAITILRFYFENLSEQILISKGTRVGSKDNKVMFETDSDITVGPNTQYIDISATCTEEGETGNGYIQGQISEMVDIIPYVKKVENISISYGGSDVESDEHFRSRIQVAPESFSTAGTVGGYKYYTLTAHQDIVDAAVWSDIPGEVKIAPLLKDGKIPDPEFLEMIQSRLSSDKIRPLTDRVVVEAPEFIYYDIDAELYLYSSYSMLSDTILSSANEKLEKYIKSKKEKLGQDIVPEQIIAELQNIQGVYRVVLNEPDFIEVKKNQVAFCNNISLKVAGSINE